MYSIAILHNSYIISLLIEFFLQFINYCKIVIENVQVKAFKILDLSLQYLENSYYLYEINTVCLLKF